MNDHCVSLTTAGAAALWTAAFVLAVVDLALELDRLGALAVLFGAAGGTLTVRVYLMQLTHSLRERERNAFEVGLDMAKSRRLH